MAEKILRFLCAYCQKETTVIVQIARPMPARRKEVTRIYYCEQCNRANKIPLPDHLAEHVFILGRDKGFLGYMSDDIPLLQGEKDQ